MMRRLRAVSDMAMGRAAVGAYAGILFLTVGAKAASAEGPFIQRKVIGGITTQRLVEGEPYELVLHSAGGSRLARQGRGSRRNAAAAPNMVV